jgi:hypothetical protein
MGEWKYAESFRGFEVYEENEGEHYPNFYTNVCECVDEETAKEIVNLKSSAQARIDKTHLEVIQEIKETHFKGE